MSHWPMRPSESDLDRCTLNIGPPINTLLTLHSGGKQFEVHNVFNSKYSKYHNGMPIDAIPRLSHCLEKLIQFQVKVVSQFIRSSWFDFSCVVRTMIWNDQMSVFAKTTHYSWCKSQMIWIGPVFFWKIDILPTVK